MVERDFAENVSDVELASGIVTKEADATKMHGEAPPLKRRKKSSQGLDKCKLAQAIPMTLSTTVRFHQTGVAKNQVSERKGADGQSIYRCNVARCEYIIAQFTQACTHIHREHLGVCVKCRLCDKRSFRSVYIKNTAALYTEMKKQNGLNQCLSWRVISSRSPRKPLRPILP